MNFRSTADNNLDSLSCVQHRLFLIQKNPTDAEPRMGGDWKFVGGDLPEGMMMQKVSNEVIDGGMLIVIFAGCD